MLDKKELAARGGDYGIAASGDRFYNPGLLRLPDGRWLLAYRYHSTLPSAASRIAIAVLGGSATTPGQQVLLPLPSGEEHQEDPRLFWHNGAVWLCYVEAYGYRGHWTCGLRLVRLYEDSTLGWRVDHEVPLGYGNNLKGREKNWQFFSHEGCLHFVYSLSPHVVVEINDITGEVIKEHRTEGISGWGFGTLSGGTPPILVKTGDDSHYLSVFHSAEPHPTRTRRYNASVYRFEATAPFAIRECSTPFLWGSEADGFTVDPRGFAHDPCVVFPGGAILEEGWLTLSVGVNDHACSIVELPLELLRFHPPKFPVVTRYFRSELAAIPVVIDREVRATWQPTEEVDGNLAGVLATSDPNIIKQLLPRVDVTELSLAGYEQQSRQLLQVP
jgi:hypothetical protein